MPRFLALLTLLSPLLLLQLPAGSTTAGRPEPRLVVLMVFDQLRGDYPARWRELYGKGGFERLTREGVWFNNCHYDYAHTITAAGHASIATGCAPNKHGIIGNEWYDRARGEEITSIESERYLLVPPRDMPKKSTTAKEEGAWPGRRLQPSVGDALLEATKGKGKVISLSIKDRAAMFLASLLAFACYWFDSASGAFVTSTYYRDVPHAWVTEFNNSKYADQWFNQDWTRFRTDIDYTKFSGPDEMPNETVGYQQGKTFPHAMNGGLKKPGEVYYDAVTCSPYGNDLLLAMAKRAIEAEEMGKDETPDLLCLSFSSNDLVGHAWGPDSHEVLDITLRTDRLLADFMQYLDEKVGKNKYAIVLSADHGICPIPEVAIAHGKKGGRIVPKELAKTANAFLDETFATPGAGLPWIESMAASMIYLNQRLVADQKLPPDTVERALARWLPSYAGVQKAYTRSELADPNPKDPMQLMVRRGFFPSRSGDIFIVVSPYWLLSSRPLGTTHGAPHEYDTHVPLIAYGAGLPARVDSSRVSPMAAAPIVAYLLGIDPLAGADVPLPKVFGKPE